MPAEIRPYIILRSKRENRNFVSIGCKGKKTPEKERHVRQKMYICMMRAGEMAHIYGKRFLLSS